MSKKYIVAILLLIFMGLLVGYSVMIQASTPVYKTGLEFTGIEDPSYVKLEQTFPAVPNTYETWIKVPEDVSDDRVGVIIGSYGENNCINLEIHGTGSPRMYWDRGNPDIIVGEHDVRTGEWIHFAVVRDETIRRGIFTFYLNGEEIFEFFLGSGASIIPPSPDYIGTDYRLAGGFIFQGRIGELRVWSTTRTAEEIKANMDIELTGNEEGLIAYWKFDEGEGDILHDSSPYGNHGTITNPKWYEED